MKIGAMVLCGKDEPYFKYCIESIKPFVDKIVVIHHPDMEWLIEPEDMTVIKQKGTNMNFADWRNQCLDELSDCSHVAWADADEIIALANGKGVDRTDIRNLLKANPDIDNFLFPTLHFMWNYYTLDASGTNDHIHNCMRLFKNDGRRFKGKVHEYIEMDENKTVMCDNPYIWHFGHCKGVENLAKRYRKRHIKDNPYTGKMSKEQLSAYLKQHNKLRGRLPTMRYDGPLPKVMGLW